MAQIEFIYNGITTIILCQYKEKFEDILQKLSLKIKIDLDSVYFLYSGKVINNRTLTIEKIINSLDKLSNRMNIQIVDNENKEENDIITKSTYVICPECKERAKIRIKNYRIRIYDCINKHDKNISLEEYEKTQKINLSQIICNECKLKNKGNSYKQIFYRCNTCKKNICPICKEKHQENHNIINFDEKNYICEKHNYPFALYCKTCKINICILCENEHDNHETISFGKIIPNKEKIKNNMKEFKNKIDLFNKNIKEIINKLNKIIINIEILYKIYEDILKNNNFKNYENLHNLNNIKEEIYIKDLNEIIEDNNMNNKFKNMMNIHDKIMNIKPIEINNNLNINGDFMENLSLNNNNLNDNNMNMNNANNMNMNFNNNMNMNNANNMNMNFNNNMNMNNVNNMNMNFDNNMNMNNFNNMNMNFGNNMNMNFDNNMNKNNINNKNMYNFNKIGVCSNFPNMNINNFNNMKNNTCINNNFNFPFMNDNNNSDRENNQEKEELIFVTFTFKKNKKQIYIDVDKNETFRGALIILEDKYDWLKTIPNIRYTFNNKIIRTSDYGKKLCHLGIDDNSDIFMLTD